MDQNPVFPFGKTIYMDGALQVIPADALQIFTGDGDMSIVGPRASGAAALPTYLDDEKDKMKVRPGITGYTQAYYRNNLSNREKRLKDAWYANNQSLWLDIKILFKTVATVFSHSNLYTNEQGQYSSLASSETAPQTEEVNN